MHIKRKITQILITLVTVVILGFVSLVPTMAATSITVQPSKVSVYVGEQIVCTVDAEDEGMTYQWQYKTPTGISWKNSTASGSKTKTLTTAATMSKNGYKYRCKVTDGSGTTTASKSTTVTVVDGFQITSQPANSTTEIGDMATFTVEVQGVGLTYQWQYKTPTGEEWKNSTAKGAKTASLTTTATASKDGQSYRCIITDKNGEHLITEPAQMSVTQEFKIITQPQNATAAIGEQATFDVEAQGLNLTYQWQYKTPSGLEWKNSTTKGAKTPSITTTATANKDGQSYRCVITDKDGNHVITEAAQITVTQELVIITQPQDASVEVGGQAIFTVEAQGIGLQYQWQFKTANGADWKASTTTGAKTATAKTTATASRNGQLYRCVITDKNGTEIISEPALLTVTQELAILTHPTDTSVLIGNAAKFTVTAEGIGLKYQWQYKNPTDTNWKNSTSTGAKTSSMSVTSAYSRDGFLYRCQITDAAGNVVESNPAYLSCFESGVFLDLVVRGNKVIDKVTNTEYTGVIVLENGYFTGDGTTKNTLPATPWNQTIEAIVDYNDSNSNTPLFSVFDNTNGMNNARPMFSMSKTTTAVSVEVGRYAPDLRNSRRASVSLLNTNDEGFKVLEKVPSGDVFVATGGDIDKKQSTLRFNSDTNSYSMDATLPWYHYDVPRKIRFESNHQIKEFKLFNYAKTSDEITEDYMRTGIADSVYSHIVGANLNIDMHTYDFDGEPIRPVDNSPYSSLHIINKLDELPITKQYTVSAYPYPYVAGQNYDIVWSTDNKDVLNVVDGLLVPNSVGTATVTATLRGTNISDSFSIAIVNPEVVEDNPYYVPADFVSASGNAFSDTDYEQTMHAIFDAITYAKDQGYNHVIFPQMQFYGCVYKSGVHYYVPSNMTIEFPEGSELHMMYRPDMIDGTQYEFHVFEFGVPSNDYTNRCENSKIIIHDYFGERYEDFLDDGSITESQYLEEMRFVEFGRKAYNCSVEITNANCAAGYFITADGTGLVNRTDGVIRCGDMVNGVLDAEGNILEDSNWISTSGFITVPQNILSDGYFISSHGQNSYAGKYWPASSARLYHILWYDANQEVIRFDTWRGICEFYDIPANAKYFRISIQQGWLPSGAAENAWMAMHDDGSAKFCEILNTNMYNSATGLFSVVGETDGLWVHDNYVDKNGGKDKRVGDFENGWYLMRHSVVNHNRFDGTVTGFASGGHNAFLYSNVIGQSKGELYTRPSDEETKIINNVVSASILACENTIDYYYNENTTYFFNHDHVANWRCNGFLNDNYNFSQGRSSNMN